MKSSDDISDFDFLGDLEPEVSLLRAIENSRTQNLKKSWNYKPKKPQAFRIKPSDLGSPCLRKIFYSYTRTKSDFPLKLKTQEIFDIGNYIHDMLKDWAKETGKLIEYKDPKTGQVPIHWATGKPDPEFPIEVPELDITTGKIDAILKFGNDIYIGEFKSIKTEDFDKLEAPLDKHKVQSNTYIFFFERNLRQGKYSHIPELEGIKEVKGVIYLYVSKDFNKKISKKEFVCTKEKLDLKPIVEKIMQIKKYAKQKTLPPKTEDMCFFCDWNKSCKEEKNPLNT